MNESGRRRGKLEGRRRRHLLHRRAGQRRLPLRRGRDGRRGAGGGVLLWRGRHRRRHGNGLLVRRRHIGGDVVAGPEEAVAGKSAIFGSGSLI